MTTQANIRDTFLNTYLRRAAASTVPWTDAQALQAVDDAMRALWADRLGLRVSATVATNQNSDLYTVPATFTGATDFQISRIDFESVSAGVTQHFDRVTSWRLQDPTHIVVRPMLPTDGTLSLRIAGWVPFLVDASTLPVRLEPVVAMKAAGLAYGQELGYQANAQTQQGLDNGRVVDYQTLVGASAYWERRYQDAIRGDPDQISLAPRRSRRN